jgi:hypothetical protein
VTTRELSRAAIEKLSDAVSMAADAMPHVRGTHWPRRTNLGRAALLLEHNARRARRCAACARRVASRAAARAEQILRLTLAPPRGSPIHVVATEDM